MRKVVRIEAARWLAALAFSAVMAAGCDRGEALGFHVWIENHYRDTVVAIAVNDPTRGVGHTAYMVPADGALHKIPWVDVLGARDDPPRFGELQLFTVDCRPLDKVALAPGQFHLVVDGVGMMALVPYQGVGPIDTAELSESDATC